MATPITCRCLSPYPAHQHCQHKIIDELDSVASIPDDIWVFDCWETMTEAIKDHNAMLSPLCQRVREGNPQLNKARLRLRLTEVPFLGFMLTHEGVAPDPKKSGCYAGHASSWGQESSNETFRDRPVLCKFVPQLSEVCEPLHRLTEKNPQWCWESSHQKGFDTVKRLISTAPTLCSYVLSICQWQYSAMPVSMALEPFCCKEASQLPSRNACWLLQSAIMPKLKKKNMPRHTVLMRKIAQYLLGHQEVEVEADHKPLVLIFKKSLLAAP